MIGLDTNVLVRYLTQDDERQFAAAQAAIRSAARAGDQLFICTAVLLETVWVLDRAYDVDQAALAATVQALLESPEVVIQQEPLVEAALDAFQGGSADFADYLIGYTNADAGCRHTLTFDLRTARAPGFKVLQAAAG